MQKNIQIISLNKKGITNFAKERNKLLEKVKNGEWALFLDSDESISTSRRITDFQFPISNQFSNYQLKRRNFFLGQYVGSEKLIRLVKRGTGKWVRAVHEKWIPYNKAHIGSVLVKLVIIHHTADNLKDYINKINNYSTLHAKENNKEKKRASLFIIIIAPLVKFVVVLIKSKNIVFSIMQSLHSFLSWTKLYLRQF